MKRRLVVRLCNYIGDAVLSVPALNLLESNGFDLHLYGKGWASTLLSGYNWPVTARAKSLRSRVDQLRQLRQASGVDSGARAAVEALVMPNSFSSALEMRLAGLRTAGLARDGRSLLLAQRLLPSSRPHALEGFWALACAVTGYEGAPPAHIGMKLSDRALEEADALIRAKGWTDGYICIAPFCAGLVDGQPKRWPGFPALVGRMLSLGWPIVVCPGPGEEQDALSSFPGSQVLEGLALDTYAALLSRSRLVVANDTGPAHMAAAVGSRVISVLGPTKAAQWAPWGLRVRVISDHPKFPSEERVFGAVQSELV